MGKNLDSSERQTYIKSAKWKRFSKTVKERDGNRCRVCNKSDRLEVHHRNYDYLYKEDENDFADLTTLCRNCHNQHHALRGSCPANDLLKSRCREVLGIEIPNLETPKAKGVFVIGLMPSFPLESSFILTRKLIDKLRTHKGGISGQTLQALGVNIKKKGWMGKLVREKRVVTKDWYIETYKNKDILAPRTKRRRKRKKS